MEVVLSRQQVTPRRAVALAGSAAVVVALAAHNAGSVLQFALMAGFGGLLVALAACDFATLRLPNALTYPGLIAALLLAGTWPDHSWLSSLSGGAAGGLTMLLLFVVLPGFGAGDVKLCALIGLVVGWPHVLAAFVAGVMLNGLFALAGVVSHRLELKGAMPYGPGLIAGGLLVLLLQR